MWRRYFSSLLAVAKSKLERANAWQAPIICAGQLKGCQRTRPPKPPHLEPHEKSARHFRISWAQFVAIANG